MMSEISLWLDNYDDIYSDFDSRHYLKRRISDDFLHELRLAKKYKKERATDLLLLLPQEIRDENSERIIINSLKDFFTDRFRNYSDKHRNRRFTAFTILISGVLIMLANSYLNFKGVHSFILSALKVLLEPGGWFLLWLGFDILFYDLREISKETDFFRELSEINIHFKAS